MFGTSTEYTTPGLRWMRAITSAPSLICGTHFGDTNEVTSIAPKPAAVSRSTSSTLTSAGIICFSFCSPSRGPTSTILTRAGRGMRAPGNAVINNQMVARGQFDLWLGKFLNRARLVAVRLFLPDRPDQWVTASR